MALTASAVPRWLVNLAQLPLGCAPGSRFNRSFAPRAALYWHAATVVIAMLHQRFCGWPCAPDRHPSGDADPGDRTGWVRKWRSPKCSSSAPLVTSFHRANRPIAVRQGPLFAWSRGEVVPVVGAVHDSGMSKEDGGSMA
jgi:hypothetical protein